MDWLRDHKQRTLALLGVRPGERVLDVGCGTGEDALQLAARVGAGGRVVGVDKDEAALVQARARATGMDPPVAFQAGDAQALAFADAVFDACRADCVFQHLEQPATALREMVRVVRRGGRIVVSEPDWETLVVDAADRALTRRILGFWCDRIVRNGWIGRALPGLFRAAGLTGLQVEPVTLVLNDLATANTVCPLARVAETAAAQGVLPREAAAAWVAGLEESSRAGAFFAAVTGFAGRGVVR
jgi:SAM-dependent methyltransferase